MNPEPVMVRVPPSAMPLILEIIAQMAAGNAIQVLPVHKELTTGEAAAILGVSRPHMVKLLDEGNIPHHYVGTHRRINAGDLPRYMEAKQRNHEKAIAELVRIEEELGLE